MLEVYVRAPGELNHLLATEITEPLDGVYFPPHGTRGPGVFSIFKLTSLALDMAEVRPFYRKYQRQWGPSLLRNDPRADRDLTRLEERVRDLLELEWDALHLREAKITDTPAVGVIDIPVVASNVAAVLDGKKATIFICLQLPGMADARCTKMAIHAAWERVLMGPDEYGRTNWSGDRGLSANIERMRRIVENEMADDPACRDASFSETTWDELVEFNPSQKQFARANRANAPPSPSPPPSPPRAEPQLPSPLSSPSPSPLLFPAPVFFPPLAPVPLPALDPAQEEMADTDDEFMDLLSPGAMWDTEDSDDDIPATQRESQVDRMDVDEAGYVLR